MRASPISLPEWQSQAKYFAFENHRIASWSAGKGPALLLIHGFPSAAWDYSWMWPTLAKTHRLIACDMLGFGFSDKPVQDYSLLQQARLQLALLREYGVERCAVLCHDYGVSVSQELLARQNAGELPVRLERICFLNGGIFPPLHRARLIQKLGAGPLGPLVSRLLNKKRFSRSFGAVFGADSKPGAAELDAFWQLYSLQNGHRLSHRLLAYIRERKVHQARWVGALSNTDIPLMHINGADDPVSGRHVFEHWRKHLPRSTAALLPGIGHYPLTEAPESVLRELLPFILSPQP